MPNMQYCCPLTSAVISGTPTKHALGNLSGLSEGPATTHRSRQYNPLSQSRTKPPSPFKCISHTHQRVLPVLMGEFVEASRAQPIRSKTSHKHPLKAQASGETVSFWGWGRLSWGQEGLREFGSWSEHWHLAEGPARFHKRGGEEEEGFSGSAAWRRHAAFFPQRCEAAEREAALCSCIHC